jgi:hypothetical protein
MMVPKKTLILAGAALALFGASLSAQSHNAASKKAIGRYTKPMKTYSLDLGTGTLTRGSTVGQKTYVTSTDYSNLDINGFLGVDTGGGQCEWFDAGTKGFTGNASDLLANIGFFYCSAMLSTNSGGTGSSVKIGFYEGYTVGDNMGMSWQPGTTPPICLGPATYQNLAGAFTLTALPGNSVFGSVALPGPVGFRCLGFQIRLPSLICFADGPVGWSWKFIDLDLTNVLGGTMPMFACVNTCSGTGPDVGGNLDNVISQHCKPGGGLGPFGTFSFNSAIPYYTSMSISMREVDDLTAAAGTFNQPPTKCNFDTLSQTPVVMNSPWSATIAIASAGSGHGHGATGSVTLKRASIKAGGATPACFNPADSPPVITRPIRFLYSGASVTHAVFMHNGVTGSSAAATVPKKFGLVCKYYVMQAQVLGGLRFDFSSAIEGTIGTQ